MHTYSSFVISNLVFLFFSPTFSPCLLSSPPLFSTSFTLFCVLYSLSFLYIFSHFSQFYPISIFTAKTLLILICTCPGNVIILSELDVLKCMYYLNVYVYWDNCFRALGNNGKPGTPWHLLLLLWGLWNPSKQSRLPNANSPPYPLSER